MASTDAKRLVETHPYRMALSSPQIRALANILVAMKNTFGEEKASSTSVYTAILRILKAHVSPLPGASVSFAQVQAARLQFLADKLLAEAKEFPQELKTAIAQGLVSGFDPGIGHKISEDQQRRQLTQQQLKEREDILRERARLQDLQTDFHRARTGSVLADKHEPETEPDRFVPWNERKIHIRTDALGPTSFVGVDRETLQRERLRSLKYRTDCMRQEVSRALQRHHSNEEPLEPRVVALLETRSRHADLLDLQRKMRLNIWNEHQSAEREGRRGTKGRLRTLKQLQREFEKVDRARIRQMETEERDARRKRQAWMNAMVDHLNKFRGYHRDVVRRGVKAVTKTVLKYHEDVAKNASRAEREAERARIQKLKDDDEEGYLQLVRQTKNTRLLELLDQTDKYLKELGAVVKEERVRSGVVEYENEGNEKDGARRGYYEIAHAIKEEVTSQSNLLVGGTLKEYQLTGIQWMVSLYNNRLNGILADEMGLGKTIQTLGLIAHLMERKDNPGPYLIIVPLSTISNWEMEFATWAPAIRVVVFKGDAKTRRRLYEDIIEKKSFNVCLVTYEYVVRGKTFLKRVEWQHIIIDEGHRIKNHESRLSAVLHDHYRSRNRLLLTGTPLQNSLTELWALLNFLLPNVFKSAESFESWFAAPFAQMGVGNISATEQQAQLTEEESLLIIRRLHQVLRPFLLRRMKADVLRMGEQLPEKQEHVVLCEMSAWQRYMYLRIVKSERLLFTDRHGRQRYDKLPNPAVQLRKCVNHPYLFFQDHASKIVDSPELWRSSGKFDMLDSIIGKLLRTGHRILIFNQMTKVVDLQERLLRYRSIRFYRLDGTTSTEDRKEMVNDFNSAGSDVNVFLLTTRAGGLGVNLQTADTVIIFDSDWNPSMDQQAQDRAHRIGQRREVLVLRMITAKSIEEDVMERASFKRGLEKKIIRAGMFDEQSKDSERQAMLRELLRVEGPGSDDENEDGLPTEEEINRLLARSEEEFDVFTEIDRERRMEISPRERLLQEREIPEWATKVPKALIQKSRSSGAGNWNSMKDSLDLAALNEPKKRRAATTNVSYGLDQLSERQYIKLMERSEAGEQISLSEAIKAVSRGRRRKRRKDNNGGVSKDDDDEQSQDKQMVSRQEESEQRGRAGSGAYRNSSPVHDDMVATKTLASDLKSMDDDLTEGGNGTGGEQSFAPSNVDDMIIEDDDDDDDEAVGDENDADENEGEDNEQEDNDVNDDNRGAPVASPDGARSRSVDAESETSEDGEVTRTSGVARIRGKTVSKEWSRSSKLQSADEITPPAGRIPRISRSRRQKRTSKEPEAAITRSRSQSSGDSGTGRVSRKFKEQNRPVPKRGRGRLRSAAAVINEEKNADDGMSTESEKRRVQADRIPRRNVAKVSSLLNESPPASGVVQPSEPSDTGEIEEDKGMEEEEDGEIKEDGEVSEEGMQKANGKAPAAPGRVGPVVGEHRASKNVRQTSATKGKRAVEKARANPTTTTSAKLQSQPAPRYTNTWLNGGYGQAKDGGLGDTKMPRREPSRPFGRMPMAQMGRPGMAYGINSELTDGGEEGEIEEEGEIVEDA